MRVERLLPPGARELPTAKYVFAAIVVLLLVIGAGHWYLLEGLTDLSLGVPLWLWLQLVVIAGMLVFAWIAVTVWTVANDRDRTGSSARASDDTDDSTDVGGPEW